MLVHIHFHSLKTGLLIVAVQTREISYMCIRNERVTRWIVVCNVQCCPLQCCLSVFFRSVVVFASGPRYHLRKVSVVFFFRVMLKLFFQVYVIVYSSLPHLSLVNHVVVVV